MAGPMTEFLPHGAPRRLNINRDLSRRWIGCDRLQLHTAGGSEDGCVRYTDEGRQQSRQLRGERGPGLPPQPSPRRTVDATGRAREGYGKSNVGIVIFRFAAVSSLLGRVQVDSDGIATVQLQSFSFTSCVKAPFKKAAALMDSVARNAVEKIADMDPKNAQRLAKLAGIAVSHSTQSLLTCCLRTSIEFDRCWTRAPQP